MTDHSRKYIDTLLLRKRGDYGPLALFELDLDTWAVIWQQCLDNEDACRSILSEDPTWFNRGWGIDGRRPNPTYPTQQEALAEIVRALLSINADLNKDDLRQSLNRIYLTHAQIDLLTPLTDWEMSASYPREELPTPVAKVQSEPEGPFPWDDLTGEPKGLSLKMTPVLYAKMQWVCDNVPRMSMLKIVREGAEAEADRLIALHFKA
jgi:hypothetical protein